MEEYMVSIVELKSGHTMDIIICADEAETTDCILLKTIVDGKEIIASDYNYLPAYQKLRDEILAHGYGIRCNGSRINAVQSGMMGANEKIYLVEMGRQAQRKDIVSLYGAAEISEFPDTQEQNRFFNVWYRSI